MQLSAFLSWPRSAKQSNSNVAMQSVGGNSAKSGLKPGDTIIYTSSWFGDELWPADSPAFVNTALARAPSPVYITYVRGANEEINVCCPTQHCSHCPEKKGYNSCPCPCKIQLFVMLPLQDFAECSMLSSGCDSADIST
jgi:hypothetical protein